MIEKRKEYDPKNDPEVIEFKRVIKAVLMVALIMILVSTIWTIYLSIGYGYPNTSQTLNEDFVFGNDKLYNTTVFTYDDSFNIRPYSEYIGNYNATYSFPEIDNGEIPFGWARIQSSYTGVNESLNGHSKYMRVQDDGGAFGLITFALTYISYGTIEWWWITNDTSKLSQFLLTYASVGGINLIINNDKLQYEDGGYNDIIGFTNNTWYHIQLNFETTVGGYHGLAQFDFDLQINGIDYGDYNMGGSDLVPLKIVFLTDSSLQNYYMGIDGIGIVGENYDIGDNLFPYLEINETAVEVDKWEFSYSNFPTQYAIGSDVFSDWTEIDTGDHVNIIKDFISLDEMPLYFPNRKIEIDDHIASSADIGIERDFNILDGILNISWSINFTVHAGVAYNGETTIEIYSNDDTLISRIYTESKNLCYKDSDTNEVVLDYDVMHEGENYNFNFYYSPYDNITFLRFDIDGVNWDTYIIPILDSSKRGLGKIKFINYHEAAEETIACLDNIGVYSNGTSLSTEPAFRQINLDVLDILFHKNWWFTKHNFVSLNLIGNIGIHLTDWSFYTGYGSIEEMITTRQFDGTDEQFNVYWQTHDGQPYIFTPKIWVEFYDQLIVNYLSLDGIMLEEVDRGKTYPLIFNHGNIDVEESYFYVSGGSLYYTMTTDDNDLEFISATFDIDNQNTINYTLLWSGIKSYENMDVEFRVVYDDATYTPFVFKTRLQSKNSIIPLGFMLDNFTIIISDNDNDAMGTITGYIGPITLFYTVGALINIVISDYLGILTPILLIVIITISIWEVSKKKVQTMLIAPTMVFMSFSTFMMDMIPLWLFFVILIAAGIFIYTKWEDLFSLFIGFATIITGFLTYGNIIDFWLFYMSFFIMVGYLIFGIRKNIRG